MLVEEEGGGQGGVSVEDQAAQQAILSLNKIDFRSPPATLSFGQWNNRPISVKHAQTLLGSMRKQGVRAFNPANRIPVIAYAGDIKASCVTTDANLGGKVPMLELTDAGKGKGKLEIAGGRHRYQAWKIAYDQGTKKIGKYQTQLEALKAKTPKGEKAKTTRDTNVTKVSEEIRNEQQFLDGISVWGIVIYDAGE